MKANYFLCAAGLAALLTAGCAGQKAQMNFIGTEEAKRLALEDAGLASASDAEFTSSELATRSGVDYYQVDFTAGGQSYQYDIDALTGNIIHSSMPPDAQDSPPDGADAAAADTGSSGQDITKNPDAGGQNADVKNPADSGQNTKAENTASSGQNAHKTAGTGSQPDAGPVLTPEEAQAKALAHAGIPKDQAVFLKSELDYDDGRSLYEVEFFVNGGKEYDYEIDAVTGEVIKYDFEAETTLPQAGSDGKMISEEKARKLALEQVPGASVSDIFEFEVDLDDGIMEYEGKIIYQGMEYEFEIDAYSGAIRSWETEPLD